MSHQQHQAMNLQEQLKHTETFLEFPTLLALQSVLVNPTAPKHQCEEEEERVSTRR